MLVDATSADEKHDIVNDSSVNDTKPKMPQVTSTPGHDADDENEDVKEHDQERLAECSDPGDAGDAQQQQQQHPKKKSRRNKSKQKGSGVSPVPQQSTASPVHSSSSTSSVTGPPSPQTDGDQLNHSPRVHQSDSRLVLQQPMPNPFVRNATHPYAPLLHTSPSQVHKPYSGEDF